MPLSKIPTSLLKKFKCALCSRYLSMAPIGIRADGESICSRCTDWMTPQSATVARCKIFEDLASLHLFPCTYRSQGCLEYLEFNKSFEHEGKCAYHTYPCPVGLHSTCFWIGTVSQMLAHYKEQHPELYLKTPNFRINFTEDHEIYYLVQASGILLLLQVKLAAGKCWFNAVYLGSNLSHLSSIKYRVKLIGEDSKRVMELEEKTPSPISQMEITTSESLEVDVAGLLVLLQQPEFIQCHWAVTIMEELDEEPTFLHEMEKIKCSHCRFFMVPPIYRCPLGHVVCADCKRYDDTCEVCQKTDVDFSRAIDLEDLAQTVKFQCRFRGCLKFFHSDQIRSHEQECKRRVYNCPECNQYEGLLDQIIQHFKNAHQDVPFEVLDSNTLNFSIKTRNIYVLVHSEIFKVSVNKEPGNTWTIYITYHGPPSLDSIWKYEVRDRYNVLYYASKCCNNRYKASPLSTYCTSNVRSEYYLTLRFKKRKSSDIWIPLDCPRKRKCT